MRRAGAEQLITHSYQAFGQSTIPFLSKTLNRATFIFVSSCFYFVYTHKNSFYQRGYTSL